MYKILVRNRELDETDEDIAKYSFYSKDDETDFETSDISEALEEMNDLLDSFLRKDILLVDHLATNSEIIVNKIEVIEVLPKYIGIVNNGTDFKFWLDFSKLEKYTIVNINETILNQIKDYLTSLGLRDIKVNTDFSISGTNVTGTALVGVLEIPKGLYTLYSRETGTGNYITSEFTTSLEAREPGVTPEPEPEVDPKFIDIYFVDQDNNPLVVDKSKLFYRGNNTNYDYEFANVSEIHIKVRNSGSYLIEVEKENYNHDPYYEKIFTGTSRDEDALTIKLTKNVVNSMLDDINGEIIGG